MFTDRDPKGEVGDGWMGSVREWESERHMCVSIDLTVILVL